MQKSFNPNKIWSTKSAGIINKRVKHKSQLNFLSVFSILTYTKIHVFGGKNQLSDKSNHRGQSRPTIKAKGSTEYKIFKPAAKELVKENIKNSIPSLSLKNNNKKTFSFGFKDIKHLRQDIQAFSLKSLWYNIRFYIVKWRVFDRFNQITIGILALISIIFVSYLSLFDTYFLVKNYTITFDNSSYLSKKDVTNLIDKIKDNKFLGILPSNQLWFLNSDNLTFISRSINPEIRSFEVEKRVWPNTANVKIKTEPILLTLGINNNEYWRIGKTGVVVTQDDAGIRENLVIVDNPVYFNKSGITFQDISFTSNSQQLNRFWYINWLKNQLSKYNVNIIKVNIPSLFDTDVNITTLDGTELKFNSESISKDVQEEKIANFFNDQRYSQEFNNNKYRYIDFRISKRIFICERKLECDR